MKRAEGVRFLGVWIEKGLGWRGQIEKVRTKVGQLLGVLGRAGAVLGERLLLSLYNGLVLPHLQYCLMVWGDFEGDRNKTLGGALLRLQKRLVGLIAGRRGLYHADPLFARFGVLKVGLSSSGSMPDSSGMGGCRRTRRLCWGGSSPSMVTVRGRRGAGWLLVPGTTGQWATGSPGSGGL